jgi:transposase, IS5 family
MFLENILYKKEINDQPSFDNFYLPFSGKLDKSNRWIELSKIIPWKEIEIKYSKLFSEKRGAPALPLRTALGALIIKERCGFTDEETVLQITENAYLQFFLGFNEFQIEPPFDSSMMVHFRKRINLEMMSEINELIINVTKSDDKEKSNDKETEQENNAEDDRNTDDENKNNGVLLLDATCAPADIRYPTDISLLNEAREKLEFLIDKIYEHTEKLIPKPRTYREVARKNFLSFISRKKPKQKIVRKTLRNQLGYVSRDLKYITKLVDDNPRILQCLKKKEYKDLLVIHELYRQQQEMFTEKKHRIDFRIVSISQPHIRPIIRGKASTNVEFGAKVTFSMKDGFSRLEKHSWENFNESTLLKEHTENYFAIHGVYPKVIAADRIYHNRENKKFCKNLGIKMTLGMMPPELNDGGNGRSSIRNAIEGKFGEAKRRFGLGRIMAKLDSTSKSVIGIILIVMNLEKKLRILLFNFLLNHYSIFKMGFFFKICKN